VFVLEAKIAERLSIGVADDEAGIVRRIDGPRRREGAVSCALVALGFVILATLAVWCGFSMSDCALAT
jgi:hypothetical protein